MEIIKNKIIIFFVIFFFILLNFANTVSADMGPKPSITLNIKNLNTSNYVVDLLVYDKNGTKYYGKINYNGNYDGKSEQYNEEGYKDDSIPKSFVTNLQMLHDINYDGWISESTRWDKYLLMADCRGNSKHNHCFKYFGTPEIYKVVIINNKTNEVKVTDIIERKDFASNVIIDYNTMKVEQKESFNLIKILIILSMTIIVELLIGLIMKLRENVSIIILTNLITNILLQFLLNAINLSSYLFEFIILEIIVFISEYLVYKKNFKNVENRKILTYVIIANFVTALLTFIIK